MFPFSDAQIHPSRLDPLRVVHPIATNPGSVATTASSSWGRGVWNRPDATSQLPSSDASEVQIRPSDAEPSPDSPTATIVPSGERATSRISCPPGAARSMSRRVHPSRPSRQTAASFDPDPFRCRPKSDHRPIYCECRPQLLRCRGLRAPRQTRAPRRSRPPTARPPRRPLR